MTTQNQARKQEKTPLMLRSIRFYFKNIGPFIPGLSAKFIYNLWFTPRRAPRPEREHAVLESAHEQFELFSNDNRIVGHAWGKGPTVLLVHGWAGRGAQLGSLVEPLLEQGYRVVMFDAPAHGDSEGKMTDAFEFEDVMNQIAAREGGLEAIVAHSFGSVATSLAIVRGLDVKRLVLISPASRFRDMFNIFRKSLGIGNSLDQAAMTLIQKRFPQLGDKLWNELDTDQSARSFTFPGLIIHDEQDRLTPIDQAHFINETWEGAKLVKTQGLGHHRILRDPEVVRMVTDFMISREPAYAG